VTTNIKKSVTDIKTGLIEIKHDKDGNIGTSIGRKSFSTENLVSNFKHLFDFIKKEKPDAIKGEFIKNVYVTSSMGVSYKISSKGI
jgi:large subunit ribosomal protein L1